MQRSHTDRSHILRRPVRHTGRQALCIAAGIFALAAHAGARDLPRYGVFVYSDLCINPDNGEGGGQRISLLRMREADTVVYEFTAGSLSWPMFATDVNIAPDMRALYFTVHWMDGEQRTIGARLSADRTRMTLDGGYCAGAALPAVLPRVTDFERALKACTPCPVP
jgi:hypothetical protein